MLYVLFALFLAAIVYATMLAIKRLEQGVEFIERLAGEFDLTFDDGGLFRSPTLKGIYRGVSLNIYQESRYSALSKHSETYILYRVHLTNIEVPKNLNLVSEKLSSKVGIFFGGQDIQVNDPAFDKAFIIRGESSDDVRAFLSRPKVKEYLLTIQKMGGDFKLEKNTLCVDFEDSLLGQYKKLRPRIELLVDCVHAMRQTDINEISTTPSSLPQSSPLISEELQELDNVGDSW